MKNDLFMKILCMTVLAFSLSSCKSWLEVQSDTNIVEKELFSKPEGFHSAVNGVYGLMAEDNLYGKYMTFGVLSAMGHNYNTSLLNTGEKGMAEGEYELAACERIMEEIWKRSYNVIANCNYIIRKAEEKSGDFFVHGSLEKNLIIGEMLGVRAILHLDMLRLFAPIPSLAGSETYIPYHDYYPNREPVHLTVTQVIERIIADLARAKDLLKEYDTEANKAAISSLAARVNVNNTYELSDIQGDFYSLRGYRMNWFAATVYLARAYQWKGDDENAFKMASEIYDFNTAQEWFSYTPSGLLEVTGDNLYRKMPHDVLFGLFNEDLEDFVIRSFDNTNGLYIKNSDELFGPDTDDFRFKSLINSHDKRSERWEPYTSKANPYLYNARLIPMIRMSEAVYIICEYLINNGRGDTALEMISDIRLARGSKSELSGTYATDELLEVLYNEMTREFLTEGQTFFLYKRLNRPMFNGANPLDITDQYVLPVPHSESGYLNL